MQRIVGICLILVSCLQLLLLCLVFHSCQLFAKQKNVAKSILCAQTIPGQHQICCCCCTNRKTSTLLRLFNMHPRIEQGIGYPCFLFNIYFKKQEKAPEFYHLPEKIDPEESPILFVENKTAVCDGGLQGLAKNNFIPLIRFGTSR